MRLCAAVFVLCLTARYASAQEAEPARDDLDVTMQIIADPDAKLPDEVVRRIPLPARKSGQESASGKRKEPSLPDAASEGQERAREAQEQGREMSEQAKERAQEAAEQREQARRSVAEERRRERDSPGPPPRPEPPRPPRN